MIQTIVSEDVLQLVNALPHPILSVDARGAVSAVNSAAEVFFDTSRAGLLRRTFSDILPFGSPLAAVVAQVLESGMAVNEYRVDVGTPRIGLDKLVDIHVSPLPTPGAGVVIMLQERTIAEKMDRQLTHRGAARSVSALASMLAHEIKNPLSGIRGAAQLLEMSANDQDRALTQLICEETDRIVKLVDRMDAFSDDRPLAREGVNIHVVLDHVKRVAQAGFARHIRFQEIYDPSLPHVLGNRDQLIQVFLNLVKNAAEAIGSEAIDGEIIITTAFRPGVRIKSAGTSETVSLPLEFCIRDNGPGISPEVASLIFDPFVTTKSSGTGLGLAMVSKIVGDHGGIVECDSQARRTIFRVLMPMVSRQDGRSSEAQV